MIKKLLIQKQFNKNKIKIIIVLCLINIIIAKQNQILNYKIIKLN
jgi:hypothetical protein